MKDSLVISAVGSVIATILVLASRLLFYRIRDLFPARSLFSHIVGSDLTCKVYILRMTDTQRSGQFRVPVPRYAVASQQPKGGSGDTYHNSKSRLYRLRSCSPTPGRSQMIQTRKEVLVW